MAIDERELYVARLFEEALSIPEIRDILNQFAAEVARDQREVCAGKIDSLPCAMDQQGLVYRSVAHTAVLNASIEGE